MHDVRNMTEYGEWLQIISNEISSLEKEKRFLIGLFVVIISGFFYLSMKFINLLDSQIVLDIDRYIKIVLLFSIMISSLHFFRIGWYIYANTIGDQAFGLMNIVNNYHSSIVSFTTAISFTILLTYRITYNANVYVPFDMIDSTAYKALLCLWGLETFVFVIIMAITYEKFIDKLKNTRTIQDFQKMSKKEGERIYRIAVYIIGLPLVATIELICTISIILILSSLYDLYSPRSDFVKIYELIKIQTEFSLVILGFLFVFIAWTKPLLKRLKIITKKIQGLYQLRNKLSRRYYIERHCCRNFQLLLSEEEN